MAYNQNIADFRYQGIPGNKRNLIDLVAKSLEMDQQQAQTRLTNLTGDYNERTMGDRVQEQAYKTEGEGYGIPGKKLEADQADIKRNLLEQMFPGVTQQKQNLPTYIQAPNPGEAWQQPAQPEPEYRQQIPVIQSQFANKTLAELRAEKAKAGPLGEFLGGFIDPMIKARSDAEEIEPALKEIAAASALPGGTREEARTKSAALTAILAKYPQVSSDPRIKEAVATATPRHPDPVYNPMQMDMAGFQRERFENEKKQKLLDRVERYSKNSEKERDSATQLGEVHKSLEGLGIKGGIYGEANSVDIPGFGVGEKAFRSYAQSPQAVALRGYVAALMNAYRNNLFGASLTEGEQRAFEEFSGTGMVANQEALFTGLRSINKSLNQKMRPESDEMIPILDSQGIMYYKNLPQEPQKGAKVSPYSDAAKESRYQAWKKANGK